MSLNLERQLCFYGAYHHNRVNVAIHMLCVPLILATALTLATNSPTILPLPSWLTVPHLDLNLGTLGGILYASFYLLLEPVAGAVLFPFIFGWIAYSEYLTSTFPATTNQTCVALQIVCWITQFIGHAIFEGRAPALFDNLVQAFLLAPFFVFLEALFKVGYRPELQKRVNEGVEKELKKFETQEANKKNGKVN